MPSQPEPRPAAEPARRLPRPSRPDRRIAVAALAATLLVAGLATLAVGNLAYDDMWWDESAQFWVSQGLSGYAAPFTPPRGFREVVRMNTFENLDPGGFSILLHLWTALGTGLAHLRALPFAFFLVGVLAFGGLGWRLTNSPLFAVAAAAAPCLYPAARYFGLEIRAYSMEMAGVAVAALALVLVHARPSVPRAALLGIACGAFLSSRYSFVFVAAVVSAAFWLYCVRPAARTRRRRLALAFLAPAALGALMVWHGALRHQLPRGQSGLSIASVSPAYTWGSVLRHRPADLSLWRRNLLSPAALPITLCLLAVLARRRLYPTADGAAAAEDTARRRDAVAMLFTLVLGTQLVSAGASALGAYPWDLASRWSAYLLTVSALGGVALAAEARALLLAATARRTDGGLRGRRLRLAGGLAAALVVAAGTAGAMRHQQAAETTHHPNVGLQIDLLPRGTLRERSVFVTFYEVPVLRYLYEHGPYAGRSEYPRAFRFETAEEWRAKTPIAARAEGIAYVITALPPADAQARFPDIALRPLAPPGRILLVEPARGEARQ